MFKMKKKVAKATKKMKISVGSNVFCIPTEEFSKDAAFDFVVSCHGGQLADYELFLVEREFRSGILPLLDQEPGAVYCGDWLRAEIL